MFGDTLNLGIQAFNDPLHTALQRSGHNAATVLFLSAQLY
ncbi:hypothetical protein imdm_733 [gamma proteobacterium IMCC2047]|nr:hypothetical protein imdm_733 [gamma proteobacterium IMCC2047]